MKKPFCTPGRKRVRSDEVGLDLEQAFALRPLARQLTRAAHGLSFLPGFLFRGLLKISPRFHFAEQALALHLLFQRAQRLLDIIVANGDLNNGQLSIVLYRRAAPCVNLVPTGRERRCYIMGDPA